MKSTACNPHEALQGISASPQTASKHAFRK